MIPNGRAGGGLAWAGGEQRTAAIHGDAIFVSCFSSERVRSPGSWRIGRAGHLVVSYRRCCCRGSARTCKANQRPRTLSSRLAGRRSRRSRNARDAGPAAAAGESSPRRRHRGRPARSTSQACSDRVVPFLVAGGSLACCSSRARRTPQLAGRDGRGRALLSRRPAWLSVYNGYFGAAKEVLPRIMCYPPTPSGRAKALKKTWWGRRPRSPRRCCSRCCTR